MTGRPESDSNPGDIRCLNDAPVAAVFQGASQPFSFIEIPAETPDHLAIVQVEACALCSSDLHTVTGRRSSPTPSVLGHEAIGRVRRLPLSWTLTDLNGRLVHLGERVVWGVAAHCGQCLFCRTGIPQKCEKLIKYGHARHDADSWPQGGLSSAIGLVQGTPVVVLDEIMHAGPACLAACAGATVAAALRMAEVGSGSRTVIFGGGVLGCVACRMARSKGAEVVVVVEPDADRRRRAMAFGATGTIDPADTGFVGSLKEWCGSGLGADCALELSGAPAAFQAGLGCLRIGGTLILAGAVFPAGEAKVAPEDIVRRMITVRGLHNYAPVDLLSAVAFLAEDSLAKPDLWNSLFGERFSLKEVEKAFDWACAHPGIRALVVP